MLADRHVQVVLWASIVAGMRSGEEAFTVPAPWLGCASDVSNAMLLKIVFALWVHAIHSESHSLTVDHTCDFEVF
jgi:hypothetical protein